MESEGDLPIVSPEGQTSAAGATKEVAKKPKGRPKGSKNKPRFPPPVLPPPNIITPYVLEVPHGQDVVQALFRFTTIIKTGLCVFTASGTVLNVTVSLPTAGSSTSTVRLPTAGSSTSTVRLPSSGSSTSSATHVGHHHILSMSAAFDYRQFPTSKYAYKPLDIVICTPYSKVLGGLVSRDLVSVGTVYVIASPLDNRPHHHKLARQDERHRSVPNTAGAGEGASHHLEGPSPPIIKNLKCSFKI